MGAKPRAKLGKMGYSRDMPTKKTARRPKRPREYASDAPFKKRPGKGPRIAAAQPPPKKRGSERSSERSRGRWVKTAKGWKLKKTARKAPKANAAQNRAQGSRDVRARQNASQNRAAGSKAVLARKNADKKKALAAAKKAAAKKPARAPRASKCTDGEIPFLFAVAKSKRCKKGVKVGEAINERGAPVGVEVRAVMVRCGGGNRKVACGKKRSF